MRKPFWNVKRILAAGIEGEVLVNLENNIMEACPWAQLDIAPDFEIANQLLVSWTYDLVVLDDTEARIHGFLELVDFRKFPVLVLGDDISASELLKQDCESWDQIFLPRVKLNAIASVIQDVRRVKLHTWWKSAFAKFEESLNQSFLNAFPGY
jgi:hypothetical protein